MNRKQRLRIKLLPAVLTVFSIFASPGIAQQPNLPPSPAPPSQPSVLGGVLSSLSHDQMVQGLKQALTSGVQSAIRELGHDGGFLTNLNVKIPLPPQLQTIERTLRALKQDQLADEFVAAMNHAAEQAVPSGLEVFGQAISQMTIADAQSILLGPPDAATQYFRRVTETNLFERFLPVVKRATDATGVTATYKKLLQAGNANKYVGAFLGALSNPPSLDIDAYVTNKALDGLFKVVAEEERRIRENPVAQTSELLRRVFGAVRKP